MPTKSELRLIIKERLAGLSISDRESRSAAIQTRVLASAVFQRAQTILTYASFGREVSTAALNAEALRLGKVLSFTRMHSDAQMHAHQVRDLDADLQLNAFNFREPLSTCPQIAPAAIELILIPGLAFTRTGIRLGRGQGHYDRFLAKINSSVPIVALAFDLQLVDEIPAEPFDRNVTAIITENEEIQIS